ncbi:MAG: LPS-assembly protein LptD [Sphingobacteriaceae bacterium]|nr:LPS-assembly protein LptD [Sphingobacteriaceae bacterium]
MKVFKHFIFLIIVFSLIILVNNNIFGRQNLEKPNSISKTDTLKNKKKSIDKIEHTAQDSTRYDKKNGIYYLYGKAKITYQDFEIEADFIRFDTKKNQVFASGVKDKKGRFIGRPIFKIDNNSTPSIADSISYNTNTLKGVVHNPFSEQEGGYFSGGLIKKQPDNEIHYKGAIYSTCNLPHPHFGLYMTKAIASEKFIITGPVSLQVENIPLPIGLPFAFFPKLNKKTSGLIFPTFGDDFTRGFFARDLGYYIGFSDYWDGKILGSFFTNGSFESNLTSTYRSRYKYSGNLMLNFASTINGLEGTPEAKPNKDFLINWSHSQNPNANPGTTFSASVNAGTSSYNTRTAGAGTNNFNTIAQNSLSSSINYGKVISKGLFNLSVAARHSQETRNKTVSISLPELSLNMTSINPFENKKKVGDQKWYQKLNVGYSLQAQNSISTKDSLLFRRESFKNFRNGFQHNIPIGLNFNVLRYLNISTSANYTEKWYLQTTERAYVKGIEGKADTYSLDTIPGFKRAGNYSLSMGFNTQLYGKRIFSSTGSIRAIRHIITPNVSLSYTPDYRVPGKSGFQYAYYKGTNNVVLDSNGDPVTYSIFENNIFGGPNSGKSANLGFGITNNVELKVRNRKDTTGSGEKKIAILQGLSINGSYNFIAKVRKLSSLSMSGRSQFTDKLGFNFNGTLDPYAVKDTTANNQTYRIQTNDYVWEKGFKMPRLVNFGLSFDYSFNADAARNRSQNIAQIGAQTQKGRTTEQENQLAEISRDPNAFVDFNIPWNFSFSYSFQYSNPLSNKGTISNVLNFNGDANITPKWKLQFNSGIDFDRKDLTPMNLSIYRDLHCWDLSFTWVPFGLYQSYSVDLKVKAAILQDLKLSKRKGFYTKF